MVRRGITISHYAARYELAFPKENLFIADIFLRNQVEEGGAGYFEADFERLAQAMAEDKVFIITYDSEEELFEAIDKARDYNGELTQHLDEAVADYRAEHPQYRPR